jgi:hypothetical protein
MDLSELFALLSPEQQEWFYQQGAMAPPSKDIKPDFDNPPNRNGLARGILITCAVISTIFVIVRIYPRLVLSKPNTLRWEDCEWTGSLPLSC